jgi:hypothetical protein
MVSKTVSRSRLGSYVTDNASITSLITEKKSLILIFIPQIYIDYDQHYKVSA